MSLLDGIQLNTALLSILTDLTGKQVLVETTDGSQWVGLFACGNAERGSDLTFGLSYVFKKTAENAKNILPRKDETLEKMLFNYADVISVSALLTEENKNAKAFATDRDYHDKANGQTWEDLELWECDEEGEEIEHLGQMPDQRQRYQKNGGWSVDEMFNTNSQMGVQSTFIEDMSQYTTVEVEGSEEDRARAERIAREIEGNTRSTYYARLENDDDERDLDKITTEEDFDPQAKKGPRNAYNNRNVRGGPANINRRAEGLKGNDRRGSGQQNRYNQQGGGNYNQQRGGQYIPGQGKRNNDDFGGEWNAPKDNRKDLGTKMVYENTNFKGGKVLLEQKPNSARPFDNKSGTPEGRVKKLKEFGDHFSNTFQQSRNEKEMTPTQSPSRPQTTAGSAWNKGPPSSLLNSQSQSVSSSSATPTHSSPTPADHQPLEQEVLEEMTHMDVSGETSKDSGLHSNEDGKKSDESSDANTSQSSTGKKFSFNPNAPAFTPRQPAPSTPTQGVPHQIPVMNAVPGVPMQGGMPPPGMVVPNQVMMTQWQPQGFTQVPATYQMYVSQQQMMQGPVPMSAQRGSGPSQGYNNQQNQRRNGPNPQGTTTMMVTPNGQWANVVPQVGYYQYPMPPTSGAQPQQFSGNPQLVQGQQGIPAQMYQQQRYPAGPMGYMVPPGVQQPRYPTPQQGSHGPEGNGQFQQGPPPSSANSTGPNSQPPTPGPQQPPPVASPAQLPHSAGGRGSPAPPPAQQFVQQGGPPPSSQQHMMAQSHAAYYHQAPGNMYMYQQQPGVIMYTGAGSMPMPGHVHPEAQHAHHMDGANMQQGHPQYAQEQYPGYMPTGGAGFYSQPQHPQQSMSRQNSIPQAVFNVGQGAPPGMQAQGAPGNPQQGQAPPVAASQQQ